MKYSKNSYRDRKTLTIVAVIAAILLVAAIVGLVVFGNYSDARANSQPENVLSTYLYNLDAKRILSYSDNLVETVNPDVQRDTDCRDVISDTIRGGVSYKLNETASGEVKKVYTLHCGENTVGEVILTAQEKGAFGLPVWQVSAESYDFSFLLKEDVTVDVPQHYKVYANGKLLSKQSIIQKDTPIDVLKDFYAGYDTLPYMVTYQVGPYLGEVEISITDAEDKPVTPEEATNEAFILDNCSNAEKDTLDNLVGAYIDSYVRFYTNADKTANENYQDVVSYIVPESDLATQMEGMLDGLKGAKDQDADIVSRIVHYRTRLAGGFYLYDMSYMLALNQPDGAIQTTENVQLLLSQTPEGLKVEKMLNY